MTSSHIVEAADRKSRGRALIHAMGGAVVILGAVLTLLRKSGPLQADELTVYGFWIVEMVLFLIVLATGGAFLAKKKVRATMNDEASLRHRERAFIVGYWTAAATALGLLCADIFHKLDADVVIVVIVSAMVASALIAFAVQELRALKDA